MRPGTCLAEGIEEAGDLTGFSCGPVCIQEGKVGANLHCRVLMDAAPGVTHRFSRATFCVCPSGVTRLSTGA